MSGRHLSGVTGAQVLTSVKGWIGVDLDGTLAHYDGWKGIEHIGDPVPAMLCRVKRWLVEGRRVKVFTARAFGPDVDAIAYVQAWTLRHLGVELEVTCQKDLGMVELWDDRCVQVIPNTGMSAVAFASSINYHGRGASR